MRKLKSLENFNQGLTPEKTRMFQGGTEVDETFVGKDGDIQYNEFTATFIETYVERDGDLETL